MAKPPLYPLKTVDGMPISYFQKLYLLSLEYLKADEIELNFDGYVDTVIEYANLKELETNRAWELAQDLNLWADRFSEIYNLIQKFYLDSETSKIEAQAISSISSDAVKVSNGDRLSNKDPLVVSARNKRNTLKSFCDELEHKIKFLEMAHYHCKTAYDVANRQQRAVC